MSSTYSPSLKIELIGTGDQSGSWGTTTNSNLGTILEQAITGVVSITMVDADYTLSYGNGTTSNESRNAVLVVGGTNTASRNVIIQPVNKVYIVTNNTAGGFPIVIKTASGTGVTVANGIKQLVYCDGTNTYNVNPNITSSTGSMIVPVGNTAARGTTPLTGYFRYNTDTNSYEGAKQTVGATITTLSRVGTTATVLTATAHGLSTGAIVQISGATDPLYNGEYSITVTSTTNFTYVMTGTPAVSPAAGTPSYLNIYWGTVGGGGASGGSSGGVINDVFYENSQIVSVNYTITSGKSAMSTGPITVNSGITVTVPSGSRWVVL